MALVPTRQLCPTTALLETSLCKFHGRRLPFFSQNSCFSKTLSLSHFKSGCFFFSTSGYRWLDDWNKTHKRDGPKPPRVAMNYRKTGEFSGGSDGGGTTMERIVEKLRKFGYVDGADEREDRRRGLERKIEKGSVEEIFYEEEGILPNTRGGFSRESPLGVGSGGEVRFPWEKRLEEEEKGKWTARSRSRTSLAELTLPESELRRLRSLMFQIKNKTRIKGGVTDDVVNVIHEKWKTSEVVRLKIEGTPALNMKRMHEILERKTGGLVIWRSGTSVALYRGVSYDVPSVKLNKRIYKGNEISPNRLQQVSWPNTSQQVGNQDIQAPLDAGPSETRQVPEEKSETNLENNKDFEPLAEVKYEDEIDNLLDDLGPRYTDWAGFDPLPVDADMLPGVVPGYQPPFRVLPYGVRSSLGHIEATALRRVARKLPPHFALGRNRQLQGLAVAMIKLWEKSSIAKIALKRGVQLTTSERMAEDIKKLTGGMLLSRNKDFLVFYRGKNFLSPKVAEALLERERLAKSLQDDEEQARLRASAFVVPRVEEIELSRGTGTLGETLEADARWGKKLDDHHKEKVMKEAEIMRHANIVRKLERKLAFVDRRLGKAEQALSKVEAFLKPTKRQADPESITEEERFMFRKIGLRMKAFLLLGRRGVFDGTIENMHLHWKYRELVKIIMKAKSFEQVKKVALTLEAESGGILVSVDKISKGYATLVYRGKDYQRPSTIRPKNLLTKRKALAWSIELQRYEALVKHVSVLQKRVEQLRSEIEQMNRVKDKGDEELYNRLDSAYPSDDEDGGDDSEEEQIYGVKDEEDEELYDRMSSTYPTDNKGEDDDDDYEEENGSDYTFRHITVNMMSLEDENIGSVGDLESESNDTYSAALADEDDDYDEEGNGSEYNLRHTTVNTASFDDETTGSMPKLQSETNPTYSAALAAEEDDDYNEKEDGNEHTLRHRAVNTSMEDERINSIPDHELETNFPHYGAQETKNPSWNLP